MNEIMLCRNMKELRELICISRLDYNPELDSSSVSDGENVSSASPKFLPDFDQRMCFAQLDEENIVVPDSDDAPSNLHCGSHIEIKELYRSLASQRHNGKEYNSISALQTRKSLPSLQPPLESRDTKNKHCFDLPLPAVSLLKDKNILDQIDITNVSQWLQEANSTVEKLSKWTQIPTNFVNFCHFWLSKISGVDRMSLIRMEHEIFMDRLKTAFPSVQLQEIRVLAEAVFHEYPRKLLSSCGVHLVLTYLDVLTHSRRDQEFCRLLSNVHCSTSCHQHTEIVLALRAFAITSVVSSFVEFYRRVVVEAIDCNESFKEVSSCPSDVDGQNVIAWQQMKIAIRNGLTDVVHYLLKSGRVKADFVDGHQRSLIFLAVLHRQPQVLEFLVTHVKCHDVVDVNRPADNGNTPLHAAANYGDTTLVDILLASDRIQVDPVNPQAEDATPLHLAVMQERQDIVHRLLAAGANPRLNVGGLSAVDIDREMGKCSFAGILEQYKNRPT